MRVTNQSLAVQVADGLQRAYQRVAKAQEIVTSGRVINHLSDNPVGATRAMRLRSFEEQLSQYQRNINIVTPMVEQSDAVLSDAVAALTRAKELTVQMANDIYSPAERAAVSREVHQLFLQTLSQANTKMENRFLFGGFQNGSAPFVDSATGVNYLGDNGEIKVKSNPTSMITANLLGNRVFQGAGIVGGQGVFDVLKDLESVLNGSVPANAIGLAINFDSASPVVPGFTPPNAVGSEATPALWNSQATFTAPMTVFDAQGRAHDLTFLFAKTGVNTYNYRVVVDSADITGGTPGNLYQVSPEGTLDFSGPGGALNVGASTITPITLNGLANGAPNITIAAANISFAGSNQAAQPAAVLSAKQTNTNGLHAQLGRIDAAIDQLLNFRAEAGARLNSATISESAVLVLKDRSLGQRSELEDADVLAAYSDFTRLQSGLQAALKSAALVTQPTLLDFLR